MVQGRKWEAAVEAEEKLLGGGWTGTDQRSHRGRAGGQGPAEPEGQLTTRLAGALEPQVKRRAKGTVALSCEEARQHLLGRGGGDAHSAPWPRPGARPRDVAWHRGHSSASRPVTSDHALWVWGWVEPVAAPSLELRSVYFSGKRGFKTVCNIQRSWRTQRGRRAHCGRQRAVAVSDRSTGVLSPRGTCYRTKVLWRSQNLDV